MIKIIRKSVETHFEERVLTVNNELCREIRDTLINNLEHSEDADKLPEITPEFLADIVDGQVDEYELPHLPFDKNSWLGYHSDSVYAAINEILNEYLWECDPYCYDSEVDDWADRVERPEPKSRQLMMDFMYQ